MGLCITKCFPKIRDITVSSSSTDSPPPPYQQVPMRTPTREPVPSSKSSSSSSNSEIGQILKKPLDDLSSIYVLGKELGSNLFGITYLCTEKSTGREYACKSISRQKLVSQKDIQNVRREISILEHLTGQPNIVEFKGAYEDKRNVHLVTEFCSGGELFDRILAKGSYPEREAASIGRQIVNVVHACHFMGVMHRDLKPENFLMVSEDDKSPIKATNFEVSVFIEPG